MNSGCLPTDAFLVRKNSISEERPEFSVENKTPIWKLKLESKYANAQMTIESANLALLSMKKHINAKLLILKLLIILHPSLVRSTILSLKFIHSFKSIIL